VIEAQNLLKISYYKNLPRFVDRNKFKRSEFSLEMFGDYQMLDKQREYYLCG